MPRLLFEKTGNGIWISHLDLMRLFQRAFKRAGLKLTHTQGFNPRPSVSIAMPLSVGVESRCELLDFDLDGENIDAQQILERLNSCLTDGVRVLQVYEDGRKIRDLTYLQCEVFLEYNTVVHDEKIGAIRSLFARETVEVEKKGKNGTTVQNIIPMIRRIEVNRAGEYGVCLQALVCCQNPSLNPGQLVTAIEKYIPDCRPDFCQYKRLEIYGADEKVFR